MKSQGDISVYQGFDPDRIYSSLANNSQTFIFIPKTNELFMDAYPATHDEMLKHPEIADKVYASFLKNKLHDKGFMRDYKNSAEDRDYALQNGDAMLGRIGFDKTTPVVSFWIGDFGNKILVNKVNIKAFLLALYTKMPPFKNFASQTIVVAPKQPQSRSQQPDIPPTRSQQPDIPPTMASDFLGISSEPSPERAMNLKKPNSKKTYDIGGTKYTLPDFQRMRSAVHSQGVTDPALCHPDIDKYPELAGYKPVSCSQQQQFPLRATHPQQWRQAGRQAGMPYLYTPEMNTSFKHWFELQEVLLYNHK